MLGQRPGRIVLRLAQGRAAFHPELADQGGRQPRDRRLRRLVQRHPVAQRARLPLAGRLRAPLGGRTEGSVNPVGDDAVTVPCPICSRPYRPTGRCRHCSNACRTARTPAGPRPGAGAQPPRRHRRGRNPGPMSSTNARPVTPACLASSGVRTATPGPVGSVRAVRARTVTSRSASST